MNKKRLIIITFAFGMAFFTSSLTAMLVRFFTAPTVRDADLLVQMGTLEREDAPGVIWNFTEIGKGTLTTNNYRDTYNFIWAIEDGKLKIETNWLYDLDDEFEYKIDGNKLILDDEIIFSALQQTS